MMYVCRRICNINMFERANSVKLNPLLGSARVDTLKYRMMCLHGIWNVDKMNGHRTVCHGIHVGSFAIAQTLPNRIHKFHIYLNHLVSSVKLPCNCVWVYVLCSYFHRSTIVHMLLYYSTMNLLRCLNLMHGKLYTYIEQCLHAFLSFY